MIRIGLAIAIGLATANAMAEERDEFRGTQQEQEACTPDVHRLCESFIPNEGRIVACLRANVWKLSPACRKVFIRH